MTVRLRILLAVLCAVLVAALCAVLFRAPVAPVVSPKAAADSLDRVTKPWKGDLPDLLREHRPIRVLVSYNRTNFFMKEGVVRGLEADMLRAYVADLAKTAPDGMIRMVFVPVPFDQLIPALLSGKGDIVAAGLTVTAGRKRSVAFADPYRTGVRELVVGGRAGPALHGVDDLAGRTVYVMAGSSYEGRLAEIAAGLKAKGRKPVKVVRADPSLVTEDLLEMAARGLIGYAVADGQLAAVWQEALPGLRVFSDWDISADGTLAWAVRPNCPALLKSLNRFVPTVRQGSMLGNLFFKRYYQNTAHLADPMGDLENGKLMPMAALFRKYAKRYGFDWLKIAAMAYQESHFDMGRKSGMGAVGVMQIKPSTAADVGIKDVFTLENNIHAGVKYLRYLCDNYFKDVDADARLDFALAAYNAGPARIAQAREKAVTMGLDPDRWFGNTEWAALDLIGRETTAYVAHVQMYYAAYKGTAELLQQRSKVL